MATTPDLLVPRRIMVIGASNDPDSVGARFVRSLADHGFSGDVVVVHPRETTVLGFPAVRSPADADPADVAIVAVGSSRVIAAAEAAAAAGARFVHVFTGGFSETVTAEGRDLEHELSRAVRAYGARLLGPNCMGIHRPVHKWTFRHDLPMVAGRVGLVSQSGGVAIAGIRLSAGRGSGLSAALSLGNCADFDIAEGVELLANDPQTDEIAVYLESAGRGGLLNAIKRAANQKPIRTWVAGATSRASDAATFHTGAKGGPLLQDVARAGSGVVASLEELLFGDACEPIEVSTRQRSVGVISISGGVSVILTGELERAGHSVPELSLSAQRRLDVVARPLAGNTSNPVDLGGSYLSRGRIREVVEIVLQEPGIDKVVLHLAMDYVEEVEQRHPGFGAGWIDGILAGVTKDAGRVVGLIWPEGISRLETAARERFVAAGVRVECDVPSLLRALG